MCYVCYSGLFFKPQFCLFINFNHITAIVIIMIIINNTPRVDILGTSLPVVFDVACTHKNQFFVCNIKKQGKVWVYKA